MQQIQSFSELFNLALAFFKKHIHAIALISVIPTVLSGAVSSMSPYLDDPTTSVAVSVYLGIIMFASVVGLILTSIIYPVALINSIDGAMKVVPNEEGESIDVLRAYATTFKDFFPYLLLTFVSFLAIAGGWIVFFVPGIIGAIYLSFLVFPYALEKKRGFDAIVSSAWLVKGRFSDVFIRLFLLLLALGLASFIVWGIVHILLDMFGFDDSVSAFISGLIISMCITPFSYVFKYFLYRNLHSTLLSNDIDPAFAKKARVWTISAMIVAVVAPVVAAIAVVVG